LEQSGYTLCSPESMYPCNHGLRGTNTKNQYDIDDLIDDFDLIKKMGGFTNDAMASGSLDKAVAEFEYLKKGIDLVAGRVKRLKEGEHEAAAAKEREQETGAMLQVEMNNENKKDGSSRWLSTGSIG
jgi:hypothetical protein